MFVIAQAETHFSNEIEKQLKAMPRPQLLTSLVGGR